MAEIETDNDARPQERARSAVSDARPIDAEASEEQDAPPPLDPEEQDAPSPLDPEVRARRDAALAHVRRLGDPILRTQAREVERFDDDLRDEVRRMAVLMSDALGIGLAAPQVGISHRLLVYRVAPDSPPVALVNPEITWSSRDEEILEEGCLSIPHVHVEVERPVGILVRASDEHGERLIVEAIGLEARVIQHEIDHLDGILILDRTTREQRKTAMRALHEAERATSAA